MGRKVRDADWYPVTEVKALSVCPLCDREMDAADEDRHHLTPKQKGGAKGDTAMIHRFCHTKIHSIFTNAELARDYDTIEKLRSHPEINRFIEWVSGKPSGFYMKNDQTDNRRKKN